MHINEIQHIDISIGTNVHNERKYNMKKLQQECKYIQAFYLADIVF